MVRRAVLILVALSLAVIAEAGVYLGTASCLGGSEGGPSPEPGCTPEFFEDPDFSNETIPPFAVTHPPAYDGSGGELVQTICVLEGSSQFIGPALRAIDTWNLLSPTVGNCQGCQVWEDTPAPLSTAHAETTILHELGHCPLGLQHPDRPWDAGDDGFWEETSFTRSYGEAPPNFNSLQPGEYQDPLRFIRGSRRDTQISSGGDVATNVHWFRKLDNNPFIIDAIVIDSDTYSRSITASSGGDLPSGSTWAANANHVVGENDDYDGVGTLQNTQSVMYGMQVEGETKTSLTADDVSMMKMAMTGQDWLAGTSDDYTLELQYVESCDGADVVILLGDISEPDVLALCETRVKMSFPQNPFLARHINVIPPNDGTSFFIIMSSSVEWDTDQCGSASRGVGGCIFGDNFESGDLFFWD